MSTIPFAAFVDLEDLKKTLLCLAVYPSIGGLLILGSKGSGKSSLVRAFAELLPDTEVAVGCNFSCSLSDLEDLCDECSLAVKRGKKLEVTKRRMSIVELPIGVTDDRVVGSIDVERTLKEGKIKFEPGLLARANRNILYIDEVNLLPDHIVDLILDAAAYGWNIVEREGISMRHPSRFILIGTMNPEEGELRPQLLDRFAVSVLVQTVFEPNLRAEIIRRNIESETNRRLFSDVWRSSQNKLRDQISNARKILSIVRVPDEVISTISEVCGKLAVDGYRPDIVAVKIARALSALDGRTQATYEEALTGLRLSLAHRTRAGGLKPPATMAEIEKVFVQAKVSLQQTAPTEPSNQPPSSGAGVPARSQRRNFLQSLLRRFAREKGPSNQNVANPKHQKRRRNPIWFLFLGFVGFLLFRLYYFVPLFAFLYMIIFLLTLLLLLLFRRKSGTYSVGEFSPRSSPKGNSPTSRQMRIPAAIGWPQASRVFGKKVSEGQQLIEREVPEGYGSGPRLDLEKILSKAKFSGRRKSVKGRGRPVAYRSPARKENRDLSVSASLRFASRRGWPLKVRETDLKTSIREGRVRASMIFLLDSSESMIDSLGKVRETIRAIRKTASRMRDRVALVVFKGENAHVLQHPTTNFNMVLQKLFNVGLSDFTPLSAGVIRGVRIARSEQAKGYAPILVITSDGAANVAGPPRLASFPERSDPATDALQSAKMIAANKWRTIIANMAHAEGRAPSDLVRGTKLLMDMAKISRGVYVGFFHSNDKYVVLDMSAAGPRAEELYVELS